MNRLLFGVSTKTKVVPAYINLATGFGEALQYQYVVSGCTASVKDVAQVIRDFPTSMHTPGSRIGASWH